VSISSVEFARLSLVVMGRARRIHQLELDYQRTWRKRVRAQLRDALDQLELEQRRDMRDMRTIQARLRTPHPGDGQPAPMLRHWAQQQSTNERTT
jgi:hypothetical protein